MLNDLIFKLIFILRQISGRGFAAGEKIENIAEPSNDAGLRAVGKNCIDCNDRLSARCGRDEIISESIGLGDQFTCYRSMQSIGGGTPIPVG